MKKYLLVVFILALSQGVMAQYRLTGKVIAASDRLPLPGASVKIAGTTTSVITGKEGTFTLGAASTEVTLVITYIGYQQIELKVALPLLKPLVIALRESASSLKEVIVSTGYQQVAKERSTGSFANVDNQLLNRSVSTDILNRLQDVGPGLVFNQLGSQISIRGQSTIFSNADPLIIVDNFPYEGDINTINPNDVEDITVLKDAAAASIWGSKAGNGVIVITTKKGRVGAPKVSFNSNISFGQKPDLFYQSRMSSADYIDLEKKLFSEGYYAAQEASLSKTALSPVVELLIAGRDGAITAQEADARIEALKSNDVRRHFEDYLYNQSVNEQYALNVSGGSDRQKYFFSAGYDRNRDQLVNNRFRRLTLNSAHTYALIPQKLDLSANLYFSQVGKDLNNTGPSSLSMNAGMPLYPYATLADAAGNPLAIPHNYRMGFTELAESQGLLDWQYRPLDELDQSDNSYSNSEYRVNTSLSYKVLPGVNAAVHYQYGKSDGAQHDVNHADSYFARNMINRFTQVAADGSLSFPVPRGGIYDISDHTSVTHNFRTQLDFQRNWASRHSITALAGYEVKDTRVSQSSTRLYGYDEDHAASTSVDFIRNNYPLYHNNSQNGQIPDLTARAELLDRYLSWYANGAYTFKQRYTLSVSGRLDQSNLFGVKANQKGVPLWSVGAGWVLSDERFYKLASLPYLKLRATYGYNGNSNKNVTAFVTARMAGGNLFQQPYATITNPPNPELRWERVKMVNIGLDFASGRNVLTGSVDFFSKKGIDLIGDSPLPPSSGVILFRGNTANTTGKGVDLGLESRNMTGRFRWNTNFAFSYLREKVTGYAVTAPASGNNGYVQFSQMGGLPMQGRPLYSLYSYRWAGLDPQTGDPLGYLDGVAEKDYTAILSGATAENIRYNGPARPEIFGSLMNTFGWKQFSLSANISYRLKYFVRKESINYADNYGLTSMHGDYALRWRNAGDEQNTIVPSLPAAPNNNRDIFYRYSEALVYKGDHVRLRDVNLTYQLDKRQLNRLPVAGIKLSLYAANLGLLWKANQWNLDPDHQSMPLPLTVSAGLKVDF